TLASTYQIDSSKTLNVELAASNYDPNLFAKGNGSNHVGAASKLRYTESRALGTKDTSGNARWRWQNDLAYEYVQSQFRAIAQYRNVEFGRDWNVPPIEKNKPEEHLAG